MTATFDIVLLYYTIHSILISLININENIGTFTNVSSYDMLLHIKPIYSTVFS